jgi:hypothetical protein
VASGTNSTASGYGSTASGNSSTAYSAGQTADVANFGHQHSSVVLKAATTDATPAPLRDVDNGNFTILDQLGAPNWATTALVNGRVVCRRTDVPGTDSAWDFKGVIRGNGVDAYSWVGGTNPVPSLIAQDAGASTWAVAVTISGTSIVVTVTGEEAKAIDWMTTLELDELGVYFSD